MSNERVTEKIASTSLEVTSSCHYCQAMARVNQQYSRNGTNKWTVGDIIPSGRKDITVLNEGRLHEDG